MKRIQRMNNATAGLAAYLAEKGNEAKDWDGFRSHDAGASYRQLAEALMDIQHGLCGYCEIDIVEVERQVEHVVPQSDPQQGVANALDYANLIACCKGGTLRTEDDERRRNPVKRNRSCGEAKGDLVDADFIDPRSLPSLPSLLRVNFEGRIEADMDACETCGIAADKVEKTIESLGLNVERLRRAREARWNALSENWKSHFDNRTVMAAAARSELLPDSVGSLAKFFTTNRSYFAPQSEDILEEPPQAWV